MPSEVLVSNLLMADFLGGNVRFCYSGSKLLFMVIFDAAGKAAVQRLQEASYNDTTTTSYRRHPSK